MSVSLKSGTIALVLTLLASTSQAEDALAPLSELQRDQGGSRAALHASLDTRHHRRHKRASAPREPRALAVSPKYEELKRSWHAPWTEADSGDLPPGAAPALVLHPVKADTTPVVLQPNGPEGGFSPEQLALAAQAFGSWEGGPVPPQRLLDLVYHAAQHFQVRHVHLVSGVRHDRGGSRHSHGLAADIVLPGVEDEELAYYFRAQGFVGVGVYTRSGFVHIDVRDKSFFWIDPSPPDRHLKIKPVRADEARLADEAALARGADTFVNPPKLQKALYVRAKRKREQRGRQGSERPASSARASKAPSPASPAAL
jgi:hypothetical protein